MPCALDGDDIIDDIIDRAIRRVDDRMSAAIDRSALCGERFGLRE